MPSDGWPGGGRRRLEGCAVVRYGTGRPPHFSSVLRAAPVDAAAPHGPRVPLRPAPTQGQAPGPRGPSPRLQLTCPSGRMVISLTTSSAGAAMTWRTTLPIAAGFSATAR